MTYRILIQPLALQDLEEYYQWAAKNAPETAARWLMRFEVQYSRSQIILRDLDLLQRTGRFLGKFGSFCLENVRTFIGLYSQSTEIRFASCEFAVALDDF